MQTIGVVIVTYNRLDKLKTALAAYERQTMKPKYVLVVNNCSTDKTGEFLDHWKAQETSFDKIVLSLSSNTGGSGGFYVGLEYSLKLDADWIWVSDDDAYPEQDCFDYARTYLTQHENDKIAALCGAILTNDQIDTWHRRVLTKKYGIIKEIQVPEASYTEPFAITYLSYVGSLINKTALQECGLPEKDFFISYDDSEHSYRLSRWGSIICLPGMKIEHDTNDSETSIYSWKKYYAIRNKIYSYRKHFPKYQGHILACYYYLMSVRSKVRRKMTVAAIRDAYCGKLKLHDVYRPGWNAFK